ncbi:MAG: hypothetical protein RBS55_08695 [Bacteroidales bacterium]|nr:hypothetical protein [Bacteroidales bacterium]
MNLICPSCGQAGNETIFRKIGQKKLLCTNCKAVLRIALKCPACDGIMEMPFISDFPLSNIRSIMFWNSRKSYKSNPLTCPVCNYHGDRLEFEKVAVYHEEYSIIM